jgi:hypothetical protein
VPSKEELTAGESGLELTMKTLRFGAMLALAAAMTFACSGDDEKPMDQVAGKGSDDSDGSAGAEGAPAEEALEIIGSYDDDFGAEQIITASSWNSSAIVGYDNELNVVYTQFPDDDMFNADKFAKTVYIEPKADGAFYFCIVEFSLDTLAEAKASDATADDSDPETTGCGGSFPWTLATPK